eukprot:6198170-Pleurochrysis_carterae.AAC.2
MSEQPAQGLLEYIRGYVSLIRTGNDRFSPHCDTRPRAVGADCAAEHSATVGHLLESGVTARRSQTIDSIRLASSNDP